MSMPVEPSPNSFFERAGQEAERYGDDPWVFLRELVQNSRDARAGKIEFFVSTDHSQQVLICRDDGTGMSPAQIQEYLLCLYASSKEEEQDAIGLFGVGFWSVLLFRPDIIRVASRQDMETCGFEIDRRSFEITSIDASLPAFGTEITLIRKAGQSLPDDGELSEIVREKLIHFAGHVRPLTGIRSLDLYCNGEKLNRSFSMPKHLGQRFKTKMFDGVLGFGQSPSVRIYKGGILVRNLTSLDEVIPSRKKTKLPASGWGLYPCVAINADGLKLLMDRHTIFEDPVLYHAVKFCEKELLKLHRQLVRRLFPMNVKNRLLNLLAALKRKETAAGVGLILVLFFLVILVLFLKPAPFFSTRRPDPISEQAHAIPGKDAPSIQLTIDQAFDNWIGSFIDRQPREAVTWDFSYDGPERLFFHIRTLSVYDKEKGLIPEVHDLLEPYPKYIDPAATPMRIRMGVSGIVRRFALPVPPDFVLIKDSLRGPDGRPLPVWRNQFGEPVVHGSAPGDITYEVMPGPGEPPARISLDTRGLSWPPSCQAVLDQASRLNVDQKIELFTHWVQNHLDYSQDPVLLEKYTHLHGSWLERSILLGAGDCDVLNGVLTLLLRSAGIEAYLSVGLVGEEGRAHSQLHAWTRYYHGGWRTIDVSTSAGVERTGGEYPFGEVDSDGNSSVSTLGNKKGKGASGDISRETDLTVHLLWLLLIPLVFLVVRLWRHLAQPEIDKPQYIRDIFHHYFSYGRRKGSLKLQFRPVVPMLNKKKLSLHELQKLANRSLLFGSYPDSRLLPYLKSQKSILDRSAEIVKLLTPFLPPVTWLEDVEMVLENRPLHPTLRHVEMRIRDLDPSFRIHLTTGSDQFKEVVLPLKDLAMGRRHVFLGDAHPVVESIFHEFSRDPIWGLFHAVGLILHKTTFFMDEKEVFLARLSREMLQKTEDG